MFGATETGKHQPNYKPSQEPINTVTGTNQPSWKPYLKTRKVTETWVYATTRHHSIENKIQQKINE